jgi:hypothetical protein
MSGVNSLCTAVNRRGLERRPAVHQGVHASHGIENLNDHRQLFGQASNVNYVCQHFLFWEVFKLFLCRLPLNCVASAINVSFFVFKCGQVLYIL